MIKALRLACALLLFLLAAPAQAQAPAPACDETELRQLRYLVRLFGETRTSAEFELAKWRARADMLETELARNKAEIEALGRALQEARKALEKLPAGKPEGK